MSLLLSEQLTIRSARAETNHAIFVGLCDMDNSKNTAKICYWVQNLVNNKRSELQKIADAPKWVCKTDYGELEYQEFRHYFNVTAATMTVTAK